jgi:predicted RNA-binding Zn ribbon-like protein
LTTRSIELPADSRATSRFSNAFPVWVVADDVPLRVDAVLPAHEYEPARSVDPDDLGERGVGVKSLRIDVRDSRLHSGTSYTGSITTRQDLPPDQRRRFRTGRVCLDFAHTGGEGPLAVWELLHEPADIEHWLGLILRVDSLRATRRDAGPVRALRAAIWDSATRRAAGVEPEPAAVAALNAAAARPALVPRLTGAGAVLEPGPVHAALSTLARDAIELFSSPLAARIRVCAADGCGLLFVDASRPGRRRWCSMERCGNRAKKRAYRGRASA